jgi:hypothetical protein
VPPQSKIPATSPYGKPPPISGPFSHGTRPPFQICGKTSHQALDCYHRMDFAFQGRHPPAQLAAMTAYTPDTPEVEQPWYLDSGANNHVTSELEKLSLQQPYQGTDQVTVGNGGGLQIANTGSSLITTPSSQFFFIKSCIAQMPLLIYYLYNSFVEITIAILFSPPLILPSRICRPKKFSCRGRVKQGSI